MTDLTFSFCNVDTRTLQLNNFGFYIKGAIWYDSFHEVSEYFLDGSVSNGTFNTISDGDKINWKSESDVKFMVVWQLNTFQYISSRSDAYENDDAHQAFEYLKDWSESAKKFAS